MTDAAAIQAVRLFPVVLQRVSAVPLPPAVHRIRTVQLRLVPAVPLRQAVLLTRIVQLRLVPAVQTPAVLLPAVTAVAPSAAKAARLKMRARSPS